MWQHTNYCETCDNTVHVLIGPNLSQHFCEVCGAELDPSKTHSRWVEQSHHRDEAEPCAFCGAHWVSLKAEDPRSPLLMEHDEDCYLMRVSA